MLKDIPFGSYYFHATYVDYIDEIKKKGLQPNPPQHNFEFSEDGVYLANKAEPAFDYMNNMWNPDNKAANSGIIVLATRVKNISFRKTYQDMNLQDGYSFIFEDEIAPENLHMCKLVNGQIKIDTKPISKQHKIYLFDKENEKDELTRMFESGLPYDDCISYVNQKVEKNSKLNK